MFEDLKKMFIAEVKDLLQKLEKDLLSLEKDPGNKELIDNIFRYMHTIKGAAGMYGLNKTVQVAHSFEDIYRKMQNDELKPNKQIINVSFRAKDLIDELISKDETTVSDGQIESTISKLRDAAGQEIPAAAEKTTTNTEQKGTQTRTFYIVFQPNSDIYERGINLTAIIEELQQLPNTFVSPFEYETPPENKLPIFWEIVVATDNKKQLDNIFIFVKDEIDEKVLCDCNAFEIEGFDEFYKSLGESFYPERYAEIKEFLSGKWESKELPEQEQQAEEAQEAEEPGVEEVDTQKPVQAEQFKSIEYIKIPAKQLDNLLNLVSQLIINNSQLTVAIQNQDLDQISQIHEKLQTLIGSIKDNTLQLRLIPINTLFSSYERLVRDLSQKQGKKVKFVTDGGETLIDKSIVEKLYTPILHIIRNAIDHGIETPEERKKMGKSPEGMVRLIAFQSNINVIIQVQDDGRGIDPDKIKEKAIELGMVKPGENISLSDVYELIFTPGFTTAHSISEISGRGMGMDVIRQSIRELRGNVEIDSEKGLGTSITIKLPATLSIIESLHVSTNNFHFLIPISNIVVCEKVEPDNLQTFSGSQIIFQDQPIPFLDIRKVFNLGGKHAAEENLIIVDLGSQKMALMFENIHGEVSAVVKNMGHLFFSLEFFIGASILGDGSIAYIIDPYKIAKVLKPTYTQTE